MTKSMTKQHIRGSVSNSSYFLCVIHFRCVIQIIYMPYRGGGGDQVLTVGDKRGWVVSTTFSKTLSTQVLTVVVLRVFSAKQLVLCTN